MIEGRDKAWHYDACIEMWNWLAEHPDVKWKDKTPMVQAYPKVDTECFACEWHVNSGYAIRDCACKYCAFGLANLLCVSAHASPYLKWCDTRHDDTRQEAAIEIAQLFIDYHPENYPDTLQED